MRRLPFHAVSVCVSICECGYWVSCTISCVHWWRQYLIFGTPFVSLRRFRFWMRVGPYIACMRVYVCAHACIHTWLTCCKTSHVFWGIWPCCSFPSAMATSSCVSQRSAVCQAMSQSVCIKVLLDMCNKNAKNAQLHVAVSYLLKHASQSSCQCVHVVACHFVMAYRERRLGRWR